MAWATRRCDGRVLETLTLKLDAIDSSQIIYRSAGSLNNQTQAMGVPR